MNRLSGLIGLMRPVNMIICSLSVICGGIIAQKPLATVIELATSIATGDIPEMAARLAAAAASATCILAAGNVFNDTMDIRTDRINAPHRPIPSGKVTRAEALFLSAVLCVSGILFAIPLGTAGLGTALTAVVLLFVYDIWLKGVPFAGNVTVALLGGLAFVYGGIAGGSIGRSLIPALFAFLLHLGRELIKDAVDMDGDMAVGRSTAATAYGVRTAARSAAMVLVLLLFATAAPFFTGYFGFVYGLIILFGVWPAIRFGIVPALKEPTRDRLTKASLFLKLAMPAGIAAVLAGFQGL